MAGWGMNWGQMFWGRISYYQEKGFNFQKTYPIHGKSIQSFA